jgi:hypothetical protein
MNIQEMITRGINPPPMELRAWMVSQGCPATLLRSVDSKNAQRMERRARGASHPSEMSHDELIAYRNKLLRESIRKLTPRVLAMQAADEQARTRRMALINLI